MKFRGGYDVFIEGRPSAKVEVLPEPKVLYLPLTSRRFTFSEICVTEGQAVGTGATLAKDSDNYGIPLLAPRGGTVRLDAADGHIVLESLTDDVEPPHDEDGLDEHVPPDRRSIGIKRYKLLKLGAWRFFRNALTDRPVDPYGMPTAVIVSTMHMDPFQARGDVQIRKRLRSFTRGLEHLQSLLEYEPIYLLLPDVKAKLATEVKEMIRGYAWAKLIEVPLRYPFDNMALVSRQLGLKPTDELPVWSVPAAGVLAMDRALTAQQPCNVELLCLGGPGVQNPAHFKAMPGYPLKDLLADRVVDGPNRLIDGGILTGRQIPGRQLGLDIECAGLTIVPEQTERELLSFVRPGWSRRSYSRCFLSAVRGRFLESPTTEQRGELRPCIACGHCVKVCPAGIWPNHLHKTLYRDDIDRAQQLRLDLCIECGLCSYVCPSKIDLMEQFKDAKAQVLAERLAEEAAE